MTSKKSIYIQCCATVFFAMLLLGAGLGVSPAHPVPLGNKVLYAPADTNDKIVEIKNTDNLTQSTIDGEVIRVLEGNVALEQPGKDTVFLWADKVTQFLSKDETLLIGKVLIIQNNDSLSADSVRYFNVLKKGRALGSVRLSDGEVQVFAPSALHDFDQKHTIFDNNVRLVDSATVLTSLDGEYFSEEKRAEFYGDVVLEEDQTYLEADSVTYYRDTEISVGRGEVFIERIGGENEVAQNDSTTRTFLFGDHVYNDNRAGYSKMDGNAMLFQLKRDSASVEVDSLVMTAHSLEAIREDSLQRLIAVDSVNIWRTDFAAVADSAVYDRITVEEQPTSEENRLFESPFAWFDSYQLSGETMRATATSGQIDSLHVLNNAFAADEDSTTKRINQLKGQNLLGLFKQDSLRSLTVGPQAESIYFKQSEEEQVGGIKTSGDTITLRFKNNDLNEIAVISGVQGDYYDGGLIPEPFQLDGFAWLPERRPEKNYMLRDEDRLSRVINRLSMITTQEGELSSINLVKPILP
ncbi:MAG: OstA-like protein [Rhodothermales bacterium]